MRFSYFHRICKIWFYTGLISLTLSKLNNTAYLGKGIFHFIFKMYIYLHICAHECVGPQKQEILDAQGSEVI